jgi:hypothetical protein
MAIQSLGIRNVTSQNQLCNFFLSNTSYSTIVASTQVMASSSSSTSLLGLQCFLVHCDVCCRPALAPSNLIWPSPWRMRPQGFDAKTVNELFKGSKPIIGPVQALDSRKKKKYFDTLNSSFTVFPSNPCGSKPIIGPVQARGKKNTHLTL